jgi:NitT/TauT family transport system permease protein
MQILQPLSARSKLVIGIASFVLPVLLWSAVSYVPWLWHPQIMITDPGSVSYLEVGAHLPRAAFASEVADAKQENRAAPRGVPANPIYLPSPGQVLAAFYTSFTTPPPTRDGQWLHQSLWHSIHDLLDAGRAHRGTVRGLRLHRALE